MFVRVRSVGFVTGVWLMLLLIPLRAKADTIVAFDVSGTMSSGQTIASGSLLLIDTTIGTITWANISLAGSTYSILFNSGIVPPPNNYFAYIVAGALGSNSFFRLDIPQASLVGYSGGSLVPVQTFVSPGGNLLSGSLTQVTTPEPSSLMQLGLGLVALVGLALTKPRLWPRKLEKRAVG